MEEGTTNRTFRLENFASHLIEQEAHDRNVSANHVINELIHRDLRRNRGFRAVRMIHASALTISLLCQDVSDDKMIEIGEKAANDVLIRDIPIEVGGSMSRDSILQTIKLLYDYSESDYNGTKKIIIAHYAGHKWSLLVGTLWKTMLASVGSTVKFMTDDNAVVFEFEEGDGSAHE